MTLRPLFPLILAALLGVTMLLPGASPAAEDDPLARAAFAILKKRCFACHGQNGVASKNVFVLDHARLLKEKWVLPNNKTSPLLRQIETGAMPLAADKLTESEILILRRWIEAGAPAFSTEQPTVSRPLLSETALLGYIEADLNKAEKRDRFYLRYFSIAHLYNAGLPEEELEGYRLGLSKLLNSLSWHREISRPVPVNPEKTLLRIDLRDFDWSPDT